MATGLFNLKQVNQAISQGAWSGYIAPRWVEYLCVAGGGGGANGGAGGGGLLTGIVTVATGTSYTVTVGAGGSTSPTSGSNSVFGSLSATGGGNGGYGSPGGTGGSGGGAYSATGVLGQGTAGQGNAGGTGNTTAGGGGGGAGTVGLNAVATIGGNGGAGIASAITGTVVTYAGGGGGGASATGGAGGVGGGGTGSTGTGTAGGGNTGGGGGSGYGSGGGAGGSGIVVVRYPGNVQFYTGGTVNYANGYISHVFYASGTLAPTTPTPYVTDYQISRSLRFNAADAAYLNRTPSSATNRRTWTYSAWVKRGQVSSSDDWRLFACRPSSGVYTLFSFINTGSGSYPNALQLVDNNGTSLATTPVYRDPSAWYHIILAVDTTQATAASRVRIYVNGTEVTAFSASTYPTQNLEMQINTANSHNIGRDPSTGVSYYDGYQTEINFIDGQQLTPSSFGYVNPATGVWSPLAFVGTYGTNGFELNFSDNSNTTAATLGKDYSGNGNNWTPNNFSVTAGAGNDSLVDSPTSYGTDTGVGGTVRGNYATMNPLSTGSDVILRNGNLEVNNVGVTNCASYATIGMSSGKWYCEWTAGADTMVGISSSLNPNITYIGKNSTSWGYYNNGNKYNNNTPVAYGASYTSGDVIGIAFDADAGTLVFYKNGTSQGTAYSSLTSGPYFFATGNGTTTTQSVNFGQRPFAYTAPSGFKALCTQNLPTPTIGATTATQAGKYFNPVLYTGNGGTQSVTGVGFQPDFTWVKSRTTTNGNGFEDAVRGAGQTLESNNTSAEVGYSAYFTAFTSDGFNMALGGGFFNSNGQNYVAWNWKANGSGSTNTSGSITSTVSANTTSGFSVVTYTGTGANATVGHGLGVAPKMVITKARSSAIGWLVYNANFTTPTSDYLFLDTTAATSTTSGYWNTAPTSTTFGVGPYGGNNGSATTYVAYCFAEIEGYSKIGKYTGNGSTDGVFVYCGFRPAYVLLKDSGGTSNWLVLDSTRSTYNVVGAELYPNSTAIEVSSTDLDFVSNGFKLRQSGFPNLSGSTYIFMAFATSPFKFSLAR